MTITRRTARFRELAEQTEALCVRRGLEVPASVIDGVLNLRIEAVATMMRIGPRAALVYAPDDLPADVAAELAEAIALNASEAAASDAQAPKDTAVENETTTATAVDLDSRRPQERPAAPSP